VRGSLSGSQPQSQTDFPRKRPGLLGTVIAVTVERAIRFCLTSMAGVTNCTILTIDRAASILANSAPPFVRYSGTLAQPFLPLGRSQQTAAATK
jgi:hypothetical protein